MRRIFFITIILFSQHARVCFSQGFKANSKEELKKYITNLLTSDPLLIPSQFSICFKNLETNENLMSINSHQALVPASNLKLLTTITALDLLGAQYRFETQVYIQGKIENGILSGNIVIRGNGDPTLGSEKFKNNLIGNALTKDIAKRISALGITKINGNLVVLAPVEDMQPLPKTWPWGDIGNYYGAPCLSLNFMDNLYKINFKPEGSIASSAPIESTIPPLQNVIITNLVKVGKPKSGDESFVFTSPFSSTILMEGTVAASGDKEIITVKGAHPNAPKQLMQFLRVDLAMLGIATMGKDSILFSNNLEKPIESKLVINIQSPTIAEIVAVTNLQSFNLYAEALFKAVGKKLSKANHYDSTCVAIKKYWKTKGLNVSGMNLYDGSGLSPNNTVSTDQLTYLLCYASKKPWFSYLQSSLPVAGDTGTLYKMCRGTIAEGKILAKTGTLSKVSAYTGLIKVPGKKIIVFSILVNYYEGKPSELASRIEKLFCKMVSTNWD